MKKINHYTMNTGDMRESLPEEIDKNLFFKLKSMVNDGKNGDFVPQLDDTAMKLTVEDDAYVISLYKNIGRDKIPVLMTFGCKSNDRAYDVLKTAKEVYKKVYKEDIKILPTAPFCIDLILPGMYLDLNLTKWTGDFCRCMAWVLLDPKSIQP